MVHSENGEIVRHGGIATGFSSGIIQQLLCEMGAPAERRVGASPTSPTKGKLQQDKKVLEPPFKSSGPIV